MNILMYLKDRTTKRLHLRPLNESDIILWAEFFTNRDATRFVRMGDSPDPVEQSKFWINRQFARYAENRYGLYALTNKTTHELIGQCGLVIHEIEGVEELEIGYHILPRYWGNGYATEAARTFKDFAFENELAPSVTSIMNTQNIASEQVAKKNGMTREKEIIFRDKPHFLYRISRQTWLEGR